MQIQNSAKEEILLTILVQSYPSLGFTRVKYEKLFSSKIPYPRSELSLVITLKQHTVRFPFRLLPSINRSSFHSKPNQYSDQVHFIQLLCKNIFLSYTLETIERFLTSQGALKASCKIQKPNHIIPSNLQRTLKWQVFVFQSVLFSQKCMFVQRVRAWEEMIIITTVSQICSFICFPSIVIILAPNSTPKRNEIETSRKYRKHGSLLKNHILMIN